MSAYCQSTRYGRGCGHPVADHDQRQSRDCCCCSGRHNDPRHVDGCVACSVMHAKRHLRPGATNDEVAEKLPRPLRAEFWRQALDKYFDNQLCGYRIGQTLRPDEPPWNPQWESDPRIDDGHSHEWERVHLIADGRLRRFEEDVVRCATCHVPRCGGASVDDPCMERRHHRDMHIHLSGGFRPIGDLLPPEVIES